MAVRGPHGTSPDRSRMWRGSVRVASGILRCRRFTGVQALPLKRFFSSEIIEGVKTVMTQSRKLQALLTGVGLILSGCGESGEGPVVPPPPAPAISAMESA